MRRRYLSYKDLLLTILIDFFHCNWFFHTEHMIRDIEFVFAVSIQNTMRSHIQIRPQESPLSNNMSEDRIIGDSS